MGIAASNSEIMNCSFGVESHEVAYQTIESYLTNDILVAAMGNGKDTDNNAIDKRIRSIPACAGPGVIAVTSIENNELHKNSSQIGDHVDVAAFNRPILSTGPMGFDRLYDGWAQDIEDQEIFINY